MSDDRDFMCGIFTKASFEELIEPPKRNSPLKPDENRIVAPPLEPPPPPPPELDPWDEDGIEDDSTAVDSEDLRTDVVTFGAVPLSPVTAFLRRRIQTIEDIRDDDDWTVQEFGEPEDPLSDLLSPLNEMYKRKPEVSPPRRPPELFSALLDEEEDFRPKRRGRRAPKVPTVMPAIERVPVELQNAVFEKVARAIIGDFGRPYIASIVRPALQNGKKQRQKQLKEARAVQAREEEKARTGAMKRRRAAKIDELSEVMAERIVRGFLREEVGRVFAKEAEEMAPPDEPPSSDGAPVVVTGPFFLRKGFDSKAVLDLFPGIQAEVSFRMTGKHTEAVLSLARKEDIKKALAQSPIPTDFGLVYAALDKGEQGETYELYTGDRVLLASGVKNTEAVLGDGGLDALARACPTVDARAFFLRHRQRPPEEK
jgi:hypothetical protein